MGKFGGVWLIGCDELTRNDPEVIVFATTLECDGDSVRRMSCVDDSGEMVGANGMNGLNIGTAYVCSVDGGVPGSPLDGVVCLSVNIISVVVLILSGHA